MKTNSGGRSPNTREAILRAAKNQFSLYGFPRVTMNDVASEAGMGKASLYYYFPTKEEMFRAVILAEFQKFEKRFKLSIGSECAAGERLREYVSQRLDFFEKLLGLNVMALPWAGKLKPFFREIFDEIAAKELENIVQIMTYGKRTGEFVIESPKRTSKVFLHIMRGLRLQFIRSSAGGRIDRSAAALLRDEALMATEIILRGIGAAPPKKKSGKRRMVSVPSYQKE